MLSFRVLPIARSHHSFPSTFMRGPLPLTPIILPHLYSGCPETQPCPNESDLSGDIFVASSVPRVVADQPFFTNVVPLDGPRRVAKHEEGITSRQNANWLVRWPLNAVVEYPQTTHSDKERIAHIFRIDPDNFIRPHSNFAYSWDKPSGKHESVTCNYLKDRHGTRVICDKYHATCQGIKVCSLSDIHARSEPHITATRAALAERLRDEHHIRRGNPKAARHLQTITLAKFTALQRLGCPYPRQEPTDLSEDEQQDRNQRDTDLRRG
ncbi:hypothetical protein BS47DRAFT_53374 [Hydnum rufescens UP504]|uniref:Uncharacterized protein n=1 Tax=Hydnum rufescens UP504 TaxID=1448309 RepID=A0A9P6DTI0_9AGAM|nr:hypothetical protein BS47DRAFT_53374 [Hydnum rufescens UP504]